MLVIEAVRDGNAYTVVVPRLGISLLPGQLVTVNGEALPPASHGQSVTLTVVGRPHVELFNSVRVRVAYRSQDPAAPDMEVGEWEEREARLLAKSVEGPDGERSWPDVEDEIGLMRHRRSFRLETRTDLVKDCDVTLSVSDKVPEQPFIVPDRMLGGNYVSAVVTYARKDFILDRIAVRMAARGFTRQEGLSTLSRTGYKVFDLHGECSFHLPGGFNRKVRAPSVRDAYGIVVAARDRDAAMVDGWIDEWFANVARPVNAMEVGEDLRAIREEVLRLQMKAAGISARGGILGRIDALLGKLAGAEP